MATKTIDNGSVVSLIGNKSVPHAIHANRSAVCFLYSIRWNNLLTLHFVKNGKLLMLESKNGDSL